MPVVHAVIARDHFADLRARKHSRLKALKRRIHRARFEQRIAQIAIVFRGVRF